LAKAEVVPKANLEEQGTRGGMTTMRLRVAMILTLFTLGLVSIVPVAAVDVDKSCREHPQLVGKCFTVRGRLSVYNGAPALRIWKIGTNRVLGVSEQRFAVAGYRNLPEDIHQQIDQDKALIGDFLVCPFTRSKPKEMQMVCIDKATNVVVKKR